MGVAVAGAFGAPVTYNMTFVPESGPAPLSGSFQYDATAPLAARFAMFTVNWDGAIFDLTAGANLPTIAPFACLVQPDSTASFDFLTGQGPCQFDSVRGYAAYHNGALSLFQLQERFRIGGTPGVAIGDEVSDAPNSPETRAGGTFFITAAQAVPEPSTVILTLMGTILFLRPKRTHC